MATVPIAGARLPEEPVIQAASLLVPGRALDIACGGGRHAIWLHRHGWQVTAVDHNVDAIGQLRQRWPGIDARLLDLEQQLPIIPPGEYDLIVCWLYHQRNLYPLIRNGLRPGGIAALCVLTHGRFAADPGELRSYFPTWKILYQEDGPARQALVCLNAV